VIKQFLTPAAVIKQCLTDVAARGMDQVRFRLPQRPEPHLIRFSLLDGRRSGDISVVAATEKCT